MSAAKNINITLKIWRQKNSKAKGNLETYTLNEVSTASSFLDLKKRTVNWTEKYYQRWRYATPTAFQL